MTSSQTSTGVISASARAAARKPPAASAASRLAGSTTPQCAARPWSGGRRTESRRSARRSGTGRRGRRTCPAGSGSAGRRHRTRPAAIRRWSPGQVAVAEAHAVGRHQVDEDLPLAVADAAGLHDGTRRPRRSKYAPTCDEGERAVGAPAGARPDVDEHPPPPRRARRRRSPALLAVVVLVQIGPDSTQATASAHGADGACVQRGQQGVMSSLWVIAGLVSLWSMARLARSPDRPPGRQAAASPLPSRLRPSAARPRLDLVRSASSLSCVRRPRNSPSSLSPRDRTGAQQATLTTV